ncbi:hypothetical protein ACFQ7J_07190 [Streptomyces sp. NPDC056501]|uniref:hypothetical protein n=1 Tax=Streptomyces sp. NPDC056501 TaxID=3345841 RepID=UPI0036B22C40
MIRRERSSAERLDRIGWHPTVVTADAEQGPPGTFDRIVSMVSMPRIPDQWRRALAPGGRLVTTIANTGLIVTADKTNGGGASRRVGWDRASFMATRSDDDFPPALNAVFTQARDQDGEDVTESPFPVFNVMQTWEVWSMFSLKAPGVEHRNGVGDDDGPIAWMLHADGSWARAHTSRNTGVTTVHESGPRRLYDVLDWIRERWVSQGELPVYGAQVTIAPDGKTTLSRGEWTVTL